MNVPLTLLGLLEREPSHGYDLKRDYDAYFGRGKPLPFGQVYATLARLARDGKVLAADTEPGGGPDRKRYVITDQGVTEVAAWLTEAVPPEPNLQSVLFVKVVLALMSGRSAERYLGQPTRGAPAADARGCGGSSRWKPSYRSSSPRPPRLPSASWPLRCSCGPNSTRPRRARPPVLPDRCPRARRRAGDSRLDLADDVADHRPETSRFDCPVCVDGFGVSID
jgi:DNA-binding PadR family transcriptional regulator